MLPPPSSSIARHFRPLVRAAHRRAAHRRAAHRRAAHRSLGLFRKLAAVRHSSLLWGLVSVLSVAGCQGNLGDSPGEGDPEYFAENYEAILENCDIPAVLASESNRCTESGCHGTRAQGGLDLLAEGAAAGLVNRPSETTACSGELLIDGEDVENSLFLKLIDAELHESSKACGQIMPLGSTEGVTGEDLTCLRAWVYQAAAEGGGPTRYEEEFEPEPIVAAAGKAKNLSTGGALTEEELSAVSSDPTALRGLIEGWVEEPGFERKMRSFFEVAFQQRLTGDLEDQLGNPVGVREKVEAFEANLAESFSRTAFGIVDEGRPFHEVLTTTKWQLTTAAMVALGMTDWSTEELRAEDHTYVQGPPVSLEESAKTKKWSVADLPSGCTPREIDASNLLEFFLGFVPCDGPTSAHRWEGSPLGASDFSDWREVTLERGSTRPIFYDLPTLRKADRLSLRVPRRGFFMTTAFLGNWNTNEDNQFRVTASQTLLVGLGSGFFPTDPTPAISSAGLDREHADTESTCYGCHRLLDPMRNYFAEELSVRYRFPDETPGHEPAFGYRGQTFEGGGLEDFASQVAQHPQFGPGWAARLCQYFNSQDCDVADPEFKRVVQVFVDSDYDFKTLFVELLSSPLVTGESYVSTYGSRYFLYSITRRQHLCALLDERLDSQDVCAEASGFIGLIPDDDFSRGNPDLVQTPKTNAFHFAAVQSLCERLSFRLVGNQTGKVFSPDNEAATVDDIVTRLMGLQPGHPRRQAALDGLMKHWQEARDAGATRPDTMKSVFVLACSSPDVMAMGL